MANLNTNDKQILEKLFQMGSGYVLNFSDRTMGEFFRDDVGINIYDDRYMCGSGSKANRIRGLWHAGNDELVGRSIERLLSYIDTQIAIGHLNKADFSENLVGRGKDIARRLLGGKPIQHEPTEKEFLAAEFDNVDVNGLHFDAAISDILTQRIEEIKRSLKAQAPLAAIFLSGSTLEGVLLGVACQKPREFNQSGSSPRDKSGKVKQFHNWTLSELINVARELGFVDEDVKKFSHALRDFRNYIHPFEQMSSNFSPDMHTAKICWQVLQAAIAQISKKSRKL